MKIIQKSCTWCGVDEKIEELFWQSINQLENIRTIVDIGAKNSKIPYICTNASSIYLFEPNPVFYSSLIDEFKYNNKIHIFPYGISNKNTEIPYYLNTESFVKRTVHVQSTNSTMLPIKSFQDTCKKLNINEIDFLKIDTEGDEYTILQDAQSYIRDKKIKCIQFEMGGTLFDIQKSVSDYFALFDSSWKIYNLETGGILNRITEEFHWNPQDFYCTNLVATWLPEAILTAL